MFYAIKVYFCNKKNNKSFIKKYKEFKNVIINDSTYINAFTNLNKEYCNNKIKITKFLLKNKMYFISFYMFNFFINIKEKREKK